VYNRAELIKKRNSKLMKRITFLGAVVAITLVFLTCSCGTSKKATKKTEQKVSDLLFWTSKVQDTFKLSNEQLREVDFYLSNSVSMSGGFFNKGAEVVDGILVVSDTTAKYSRTFDKNTKGKVTGIPQKDPGSPVIKSLSVLFEKGELSYTFQFDLAGDGTYALNPQGHVTLDGIKYKITTYNPENNNQAEKCKLLFRMKRQSVIINDVK
jgi:hypothetical protein